MMLKHLFTENAFTVNANTKEIDKQIKVAHSFYSMTP
jgi:hypothetical protein